METNLSLAFSLIFIGFYGATSFQKNLIGFLLSIEVLLLGISLLFISFSLIHNDHMGQIISILILVLAGAESVLGLTILLVCNRIASNVNYNSFNMLKG
jgi:NADH:ubiquinone oxidoreductase subunit K